MDQYKQIYDAVNGNLANADASTVKSLQSVGHTGYKFIMSIMGSTYNATAGGILSSEPVWQAYNCMKIIAFAILVFAFIKYAKNVTKTVQGLRLVIFIFSVVALMMGFEKLVAGALEITYNMSPAIDFSQIINKWASLQIITGDSWEGFTSFIAVGIYQLIMNIAFFICIIAMAMQGIILAVAILLSPIMISLIAIKEASEVSVRFILSTASVCLWPFSYAMANSTADYLMQSYMGGMQVGTNTQYAKIAAEVSKNNSWYDNVGDFIYNASSHLTGTTPGTSWFNVDKVLISPEFNIIKQHSSLIASIFFLLFAILFYIVLPMIISKLLTGSSPVEAALGSATNGAGIVAMAVGGGFMISKGAGNIAEISSPIVKKGLSKSLDSGTNIINNFNASYSSQRVKSNSSDKAFNK